ncbi:hypothetical protein AB0H86_14645 [Streptomyces sp. NPDC050997]|uniref:hypothetical protein n=1 Tax=Streptomyces sp. NPDC050997 TaxID=3155519 RepID=UPI00343D405C
MNSTRRTILRGMAAAPLVATTGGLLVPESAMASQAAQVEAPLTLTYNPAETSANVQGIRWLIRKYGGRRYNAATISLARAWQVTNVTAEDLNWPTDSPKPEFVFGWSPNDQDANTAHWHPQGVTTYYDAWGRNGKRMMVSWYNKSSSKEGARIAVIDRSGNDRRYHYVTLVRAKRSGKDAYTTEALSGLHAGGLAWYRNRLYVTDSENGALLVFNTDDLFKPGGDTPYEYAMPLSRIYTADEASKKRLTFSQVSVDRTSLQGPIRRTSLIVNSFDNQDPENRPTYENQIVGRWSFEYNSGSLQSSGTTARSSSVYRVNRGSGLPVERGIQGAVAIRNRLHLSVSDGVGGKGLFSTVPLNGEGVGTAVATWQVPRGPEDLSYEERSGRGGWVWGLGEYVGNRHVYAMRVV